MEKPISYFDWKLHFRNNFPLKNGEKSSKIKLHSLNEFNILLRNFYKRESLLKSAGIISSQFDFQNLNLTSGIITCTIKNKLNEDYQIEINKKGEYVQHRCQEFWNLNKFEKYFCSHIIRLFFILKENDKQKTVELLKHITTHDYNFFPRKKKMKKPNLNM